MKRGAVVHCTVIPLSIAAFLALPAAAQVAAKLKSSQTVLGVPCSEIRARGIDKQENLGATLIRTECGLDAPGEAFEASESGPILDLTNINLITGDEIYPNVTQSESMAWSTQDGQTIVVTYNDGRDFSASPLNISGASVSFDGGKNFQRISPHSPFTGRGNNLGDPVVVYNEALGRWYAGFLVQGCGGQGVGLWESTDALTWTVGACAHTGGSDDRESMWVDNNSGSPHFGRMYVSWNDYTVANQPIFVTHSDDGTTWSTPLRVSTTFIRNIQLTGSPDDGTVFIEGMDEGGGGVSNRINYIYRSVDGGASWTQIQQGPPFAPPGEALCGYFAAIRPIWRHMGWGQPAVGPNGVVHYAYAAKGSNPGDLGDILYIRSEDNGDTWSAPITLNSDVKTAGNRPQWMPSLSVTPEGRVVISWYDRRNTTDFSYEIWGIQSDDNGQTWSSDDRFSDQVIPEPEAPNFNSCYAGDYNYDSAVSSMSWVTWTDGRVQISGHNQQDVFFAAVPQITTGGTLQGTVTDTTGNPVAGARVQAVGPVTRNATTRGDGTYRLTSLPDGSYDMTVTEPDHNPGFAGGVIVVEGQTTIQDFVLSGAGILQGTVVDAQGAPLSGVRVQVVGPVTRNTTTDSNGFYRFRLPVGTYDVTAILYLYNPGTATDDVVDGMTTTQNFTLSLAPAHSIFGTVTNLATGLPVAGATVRILNTPIPPATTDANGMYLFATVPDGIYDIQASAPGFLSQTQTGVLVNQDTEVDFGLDSSAVCDHVPGNLVANCGFESGDFNSWTRSGDMSATSITTAAAHSGTWGLFIGPVSDLGFIAQNLPTISGASYQICYWLSNLSAGTPNRFQVSWGGTVIRDDSSLPAFPYTQYCHDVVAPGDTTEVKFGFLQAPSYFEFDDASVAAQ